MNSYCSVPKCTSWAKEKPELSFHLFPEAGAQRVWMETKLGSKTLIDRRKVWIFKLKIVGKAVSKFMKVCSLHFTEEDYFYREPKSLKRRALKRTAVPSQKLPFQTESGVTSSGRTERVNKRRAVRETVDIPGTCDECSDECNFENETQERITEETEAAETLIGVLEAQSNYKGPRSLRDFAVQVNTPKIYTLCDLLTTDSALNSFTGLNSIKLLETIVEAVQSVYKDQRSHRLTMKERIVLLLTKLKCDLTYITLSIVFGISPELCKKYIFEMLPVLSKVLNCAIKFPNSAEIKNNMPKCFEDFQNVRIILDCTEIYIQKPKCLCCRIRFYSQYKSNNTVKFMTGVSPSGTITFISDPFGGRASDKTIFEQTDLILKMECSKDAIMVDKGFLIDDVCQRFQIKLVRPPFLRKQKQLTVDEALLNSKIASARVHIERANQRIKIFKILSGKLQWSLVTKVKDIFIIACAITNLSSPILSDCRFLSK